MFVGLFGSDIGVKLGEPDRAKLAAKPGAGPFGPADRPMGGYVTLPATGQHARFRRRLRRAMELNPGVERWVIIDFEGIGSVDATAVEEPCDLVDELHDEGVVVGTARANDVVVGQLRRGGVLERIGPDNVHPTINRAVHAFRRSGRDDERDRDDRP